jgi:hypothetical protein
MGLATMIMPHPLIPAKAGPSAVQPGDSASHPNRSCGIREPGQDWVPAFAGMSGIMTETI